MKPIEVLKYKKVWVPTTEEFFYNPDGTPFYSIETPGHYEIVIEPDSIPTATYRSNP